MTPDEETEASRLILDLKEQVAWSERIEIANALSAIGDHLARTHPFGRSLSGLIGEIERYIRTAAYKPKKD